MRRRTRAATGLLPGAAAVALTVYLFTWAIPEYAMVWLLPDFVAVVVTSIALAAAQITIGLLLFWRGRRGLYTAACLVLAGGVLATYAAVMAYTTQPWLRVWIGEIYMRLVWL